MAGRVKAGTEKRTPNTQSQTAATTRVPEMALSTTRSSMIRASDNNNNNTFASQSKHRHLMRSVDNEVAAGDRLGAAAQAAK